MQVLVTGGAGFIGSHLVRAFLREGFSVRVLDDLATGRLANIAEIRADIEFIEGSVVDPDAAARAVRGCEAVFHQAAIPSVARSVQDPVGTSQVNVGGTLQMLTAARDAGVRRFILAASSSAYGDNPELPKREDMVSLPRSPYAVAKLASEQFCQVFGKLFPIETVCLRYFNVFGPRQDPKSKYAAVVPAFIQAALAGQPVTLDGGGTQSRDFTYIDNVIQANLCALRAPGVSAEVFNVGCGQRYDLNRLIDEIGEITGAPLEVHHEPARPGDVPHSLADISKARAMLGYDPAVDFREGLRRTVEWFRTEGARFFA